MSSSEVILIGIIDGISILAHVWLCYGVAVHICVATHLDLRVGAGAYMAIGRLFFLGGQLLGEIVMVCFTAAPAHINRVAFSIVGGLDHLFEIIVMRQCGSISVFVLKAANTAVDRISFIHAGSFDDFNRRIGMLQRWYIIVYILTAAVAGQGTVLQDRGRFFVLTKHRDMVYWSRVMEYA